MINQIIKDLKKGVLCWYKFNREDRILCIIEDNHPIVELVKEKCQYVDQINANQSENQIIESKKYDKIISLGVIEILDNPIKHITYWKKLLKPSGKLLLGVENRLGLRYFCGDIDKYTGKVFSNIERNEYSFKTGKANLYSKNEVSNILEKSGFNYQKYYTILPNLEYTQLVYSEDYLPKEKLSTRYFPLYNYPENIFMNEELIYDNLINNNMFHQMANSYLIECPLDDKYINIKSATISIERGRENAMATVIYSDDKVRKIPLYKEGEYKLDELVRNETELKTRGVKVVEGRVINNSYELDYIDEPNGEIYLKQLFWKDIDKFEQEIDKFYQLILSSSEIVDISTKYGPILQYGFPDMVPHNTFLINGEFMFFDQEFKIPNYPAKAILYRSILIIYIGDSLMESKLPISYWWNKYEIQEMLSEYSGMNYEFVGGIRNGAELANHWKNYIKNEEAIKENRKLRITSPDKYKQVVEEVFKDIKDKKIVLFGAGKYAEHFIDLFGKMYSIESIVDNNKKIWGEELRGITIINPEHLLSVDTRNTKIIVCIKNYNPIIVQLNNWGIKDYAIYDKQMNYKHYDIDLERERVIEVNKVEGKKYRIGYIAGVFDMFHVGHVKLFSRAKEQCQYLIVGILDDEGVKIHKGVTPVIPFKQRIEIIKACKYVDEVVVIPNSYERTMDAYKMYHFDCQFSGSDYEKNERWLQDQEELRKNGSDMVFFEYSKENSTTSIKKLIGFKDN